MPLTITTGQYVGVKGGAFEFDGGTLNLASGTHLDLDYSGTSNWKGGDFSPGTGGGTVYLFHSSPGASATLNILGSAHLLGANLVIGEDSHTADSTAVLNVSSATSGMSGDLKLQQDATITNYAQGTINLNQSVNSDTKGGIITDTSIISAITSSGTINRTTVDTTGKNLYVLVPITQQNSAGARFNLGAGCTISVRAGANGITVKSGILKQGKGSDILGGVNIVAPGKRELDTTGGTGNVNFYLDGDLTTDGGTIQFDYTAGAWAVDNISGNLTVAGGTTVDVNVDGSTSGTSDTISVGGTATLDNGVVDVAAQNASAPGGNSYTILTATSGVSGTWGSAPANDGYYADDWQYDSSSQGVIDSDGTPTVSGVSPSSGATAGGTAVTITGTDFSAATAVSFGGVAATSFTVVSSTSITAYTPAHAAGTVDITVTTSGGGTSPTSSADQFTYVAAPVVMGISPSSGPPSGGTSVTIYGSHFTGATAVYFGSIAAASFTVNSDGSITAVSPDGAMGTTVDITVVTPGGTSATSSADQFTYYAAAPYIMGISPSSGSTSGETAVRIGGYNLSGVTAVYLGTVAATSFTINSDGTITAIAPPGSAGTVDITVVAPGGTSPTDPGDEFTYF